MTEKMGSQEIGYVNCPYCRKVARVISPKLNRHVKSVKARAESRGDGSWSSEEYNHAPCEHCGTMMYLHWIYS